MPRRNRSETGRFYRWPAIIAAARDHPGEFQLLLPDAPRSVLKTIRLRRAQELVLTDGILEAYGRDQYRDRDGVNRANVYIRFVPHILTASGIPTDEETQ